MRFANPDDWCGEDARPNDPVEKPDRPMPWYRVYRSDLNDRKLQELPAGVFKTAVNLRNVATHLEGEPPEISEIAYALRFKTTKQAEEHVEKLVGAGFLERRGSALYLTSWTQCASDDERRNKEKQRLRTKRPRTRPHLVFTQRERKTETEIQSNLSRSRERGSARTHPNGSPMTETMVPTERTYAEAIECGLSRKDCDVEFDRFRDHHLAKGDVRSDWDAAFRSWLAKRDRFAGRWAI